MQAASTAFGTLIDGVDTVVESAVTVQLPVWRTNWCPNPSYEYGTTGWSVSGATVIARSSTRAHGLGSYSGAVTWGTASAGLAPLVAAVPLACQLAAHVEISVWVFVPSGSPAVTLSITSGANTDTATSGSTNAWVRLTCDVITDDVTVTVTLKTAAGSTAGQQVFVDEWLWEIDPVSAFDVAFDGDDPADINIAYNPSFEQPICTGDTWTPTGCTALQDPGWAADGGRSIALTPTSGSNDTSLGSGRDTNSGMEWGLLPGHTYTVSATVNVPVALAGSLHANACKIVAYYRISPAAYTTVASSAGPTGGGTQRLSVTFTIPAGVTDAYVRLYNGAGNTAANVVRWDAVLLRADQSVDAPFFGGRRLSARNWSGMPGVSSSTLNIDPYPDVTLAIESIRITRQMVTDMPTGTRLIAGYPSATATVVLSGMVDPRNEAHTAAWLFNSYDPTSPLYTYDPADAPVLIEHGLCTAAGVETVRTFTGTVDEAVIDAGTGTAELTCIDTRQRLRPAVALQSVVYSNPYWVQPFGPGLTGLWVLDAMLRSSGINSGPPPRPDCVLYASFHGSAMPEVSGDLDPLSGIGVVFGSDVLRSGTGTRPIGTPTDYANEMVPGVWSQQCARMPGMFMPLTRGVNWTGTNNEPIHFEAWIDFSSTTYEQISGPLFAIAAFDSLAATTTLFEIIWQWDPGATTTGNGQFEIARTSGASIIPITTAFNIADGFHHITIHVVFPTSTTATLTITDNDVTTVQNLTLTAWSAQALCTVGYMSIWGVVDTAQFTTEADPLPPQSAFWPDAYLDASLNPLVATVDTNGIDPWTVVQQLAEAESAVAGFDERGIFRFTNRDSLLAAAAVRTVSADKAVVSAGISTQKSTAANRVQAPINQIGVGPPTSVWQAADVISIASHGTYTALITTDTPVSDPQVPSTGYNGGALVDGTTVYRAARTAAGHNAVTTGLAISTISLSPSTLRLSIHNTNTTTVYLVSPDTLSDVPAGTPWLYIGGYPIVSSPGVLADSQWPDTDVGGAASTPGGETLLSLPPNPWLQDLDVGQTLTDDTVTDVHRPRPLITNLAIIADPRLQITDRVTVFDDGMSLDDDVVISGIEIIDSRSEWTATLDARTVAPPGTWVMGDPDRSVMGVDTYA